ncbi:substrate-binding periplasmic protein [Aquibaculum arenosum]|uniref:Transporter substrate-binding domain-containing protein n=1 Tax=Aquibaculum arenosum TaxID=3032591 RepID=A0ABT5YMK9_9PROT|nr:transporter substrate-binding domain-containing protein [Fodinicurvata sp. CAU 1616]MDF2096193.1 transporter substrate-binding domain-containing protein [Fodinicurvata sp. CAU 1616]
MAWIAVAGAQERANPLIVGVEELNYLPAYGRDENGEYAGFGRAILDAFAEDHGYDLVYRPLPITRLYSGLLSGSIDLKYPDNPRWAEDRKAGRTIAYSAPAMTYIDGNLVTEARDGHDVELIGTVLGFTPWAWLDRIEDDSLQLIESTDLVPVLRQLFAGRIDAAYANVAVAKHVAAENGLPADQLVFRDDLPYDRGTYHLSTTKHPELIAQFDHWLEDNAERVEAMREDYGVGVEELLEPNGE